MSATQSLSQQSSTALKTIEAVRTNEPMSIDGRFLEAVWQREGFSDFTQREPDEGKPPTQKTELWVAYDDDALYIAALMHDTSPDSIVGRSGRRDADFNSDMLTVIIDSYNDKRSGFSFAVNPKGAVTDGIIFNDTQDDDTWDGVWDAAARVNKYGWWAEIRIPFSQLRFAEATSYRWGFHAFRTIQRRKEEDWIVSVPLDETPRMSKAAQLIGISGISPHPNIEVVPYVTARGEYVQDVAGNPFNDGSIYAGNAGADLKWGIGNNFVLNATVNPDFGQVEVDPAVVNLSQYETFFAEKRPFFVEGSNFFNFGRGGANSFWSFNWSDPLYFYSRRVGRSPRGSVQHNGFADIPDRTSILGAAKITGKISQGWSVGALESLTARESAEVDSAGVRFTDPVEPLASTTVIRSLYEFDEARHGLGVLGTGLLRDLKDPSLRDSYNERSFSGGLDGWATLDDERAWVLSGWATASNIQGSPARITSVQNSSAHYFQRPDASHLTLKTNATSLSGFASRLVLNKQKGSWQFNSGFGLITPGFDANDLGFLSSADIINAHVMIGYQWFDPDRTFRRKGWNLGLFQSYNFGRLKTSEGGFLFWNLKFLNYWGMRGVFGFNSPVIDATTTRGGPYMKTTWGYVSDLQLYSDPRNNVEGLLIFAGGRTESGGYRFSVEPSITFKPGPALNVSVSGSFFRDLTTAQWVQVQPDPTAAQTFGTRYVFGRLDQKELSAILRVDFAFTPKMSLQAFIQPLISVGMYDQFKELARPGAYEFNTYGKNGSTITYANDVYTIDPDGSAGPVPLFTVNNPNFNFKSLRANFVFRWEYFPGSTIYLVWTNSREDFADPGQFSINRDLTSLFSANADNVLALKLTYWINP